MKIGDRYDISHPDTKAYVQSVINSYGVSKDLNQIGLSVLCKTENGQQFELIQLNNSRHIIAVCGV